MYELFVSGEMGIQNWSGSLSVNGGLVGYKSFDSAYGVPLLDSNGKIQVSQLPNSVMEYKGTWNVTTNTPYLVNGTGNAGDVYIVTGAATGGTTHDFGSGPILFYNGDQAIYDGSAWQRASGSSGTVTSVAMSVPVGLSVTGSPITTSGTLAVSLASGYTIPLSTQLVPSGGTAGQILAKNSATSYDTSWIDNYTEDIRDTVKATQTINKGQAVYISGANGTNQLVSLADYTSEYTSSQTLGIARVNFATNDIGQIVTYGLLSGIDTSTATAGDPIYLGASGNLLFGYANKPYAPYHLVYIGVVTRSHAVNGEIFVNISNGWELDELHNVSARTPSNNDVLYYQSSTSLWKNASIASILGYTPISLTSLSATSPLSYDNTTGVFSISQASGSTNGYLSSTDWTTFNSKQAQLNGTGFVKASGTTISYDNSTYLTTTAAASTYVPYTGATGAVTLGANAITANNFILNGQTGNTGMYWTSDRVTIANYNATGQVVIETGGGNTAVTFASNQTATFANGIYANNGVYLSTSLNPFYISNTDPTRTYGKISNNQGSIYWGVEGSGANALFTGTTAYSGAIGTSGAKDFQIASGGTVRLTLNNSTGAATFSSSVTQTTSDSRLLGGDTAGRYIISNSDTSAYLAIYGSTNASANVVGLITNTYITFTTGSSYTERMRITSGGYTKASNNGSYQNASASQHEFNQSIGDNWLVFFQNTATSPAPYGLRVRYRDVNGTGNQFLYLDDSGGLKFQVLGNGNVQNANNSYGAISDINLKENIIDASNKLNDLLKVKIRNYNLISDENKTKQIGIIAQELEEIFPNMIETFTDADSKKEFKSVKYSVFVPMLIKAIQEQQSQIEDKDNKISVLEEKLNTLWRAHYGGE